jgi:hypothetical protein
MKRQEKKILEWINGDLSDKEVQDLQQSEDDIVLEKIIASMAALSTYCRC